MGWFFKAVMAAEKERIRDASVVTLGVWKGSDGGSEGSVVTLSGSILKPGGGGGGVLGVGRERGGGVV